VRRAFRRFRRYCWKWLIWFVIASAVLVSIGRLVAPYADAFRPVVERFLAAALDQPVRIERVEASWPHLSPQITLRGLEVGAPAHRLLDVDEARLEFKLYNLVHPGRNSFEMIVLGLDLVLVQDEAGRWSWRLDRGGRLAEGWEELVSAGDVLLRDAGIRIAPHGTPDLNWSVPEARLSRRADRLRVRMQAVPEGGAGDPLEARLVLHMPASRLEAVSGFARSPNISLSRLAFDSTAAGAADLRAQMQWWLEWNRDDGARFHGEVGLHSLSEGGIAGRMSSHFQLDGRWRADELVVELNAQEFGDNGAVLIDGLAYGNRAGQHGIVAGNIDLNYLQELLRPWLGFFEYWPTRLSGTATDLALGFSDSGGLHAAGGRLKDFTTGFETPGLSLSVEQIDLSLAGDQLRVRPAGAVELEMPGIYSEPLALNRLTGTVGWRPEGLELDALALQHAEFALIVEGAVELGDQPPIFDLVADLLHFSTDSPRRWLPAKGLDSRTLNWLNDALLRLGSARAVTTLNSRVEFSDLRLAYAKNWPIAEQVAGSVELSGQSMDAVVDSARVAGVELRAPEIHLADLRDAELELRLATTDTGADDLSRLAAALPLIGIETALEQLEWKGPATAEASVWLPVSHRTDWRLLGSIQFDDAAMSVPGFGKCRLRGNASGHPVLQRGCWRRRWRLSSTAVFSRDSASRCMADSRWLACFRQNGKPGCPKSSTASAGAQDLISRFHKPVRQAAGKAWR